MARHFLTSALLSFGAAVMLALLAACSSNSDPSGAAILRLSENHAAKSTVVFEVQAHPRQGNPEQISVYEYSGTQTRQLFTQSRGVEACRTITYDPRGGRSAGAAESAARGGTASDEIERLGKTKYEGTDAWRIRYRYDSPSVEGPYPVEVTEWIATDDYRLLRAEREIFDPFGLVGQLVLVARSFDAQTPCPSKPELDPAKLKPLTEPRLKDPSASR